MREREQSREDYERKRYKNARKEFKKQLCKVMVHVKKGILFSNSTEMLKKLHNFIKKYRFFCKPKDLRRLQRKIRICRKCDRWSQQSQIWQCYLCQDYYHEDCSKPTIYKLDNKERSVCKICQKLDKQPTKCKFCTQNGIKRKEVSKIDIVRCLTCRFGFHKACLTDDRCKKCIENSIKAQQFQQSIAKFTLKSTLQKQSENDTVSSELSQSEERFRFKNLLQSDKEYRFYRNELMQAIRKKKMTYVQELIGIEEHMPKITKGNMDFGLEYMTQSELAIYKIYKQQPIGPFKLVLSIKGYDVVADKDIPNHTLICEYIGEVLTLRQCIELGKNDSDMHLQTGRNSSQTLIIRPQNYTNMARFINGVKQNEEGNVKSMHLIVEGKPCVLLVSCRQIKKGESLAYDYNAGSISSKYDTSGFV